MDIISQLQEQLNEMAMLAVNTFGTLQRDAPPVRLSSSYPDPLNPNPNPDDPAAKPPQPRRAGAAAAAGSGSGSAARPSCSAAAACARPRRGTQGHEPRPRPCRQEEDDQLKRIQELQAENEVVGLELQKQLEATEQELKQVEELFNDATDNCINFKKPDQ
ncbi:hypothetical protein PR202_gb28884 [Eleusine coracana subsp. coracana]|uniref:Mediator of RNA polymerase II transcription subunit 21 n=1 Tax=Eleusine coracana subsp. coracana TaxID=191504 RepID=A0AAV5FYM6_ELECO|nr:hypothetical protein PR202_gb28884 [Eleusine coracana subsp. coracana]